MGTYFSLIVKGLYAGTIYFIIVLLLEMQFPGSVMETTFTPLGFIFFFILFALDFIYDYT